MDEIVVVLLFFFCFDSKNIFTFKRADQSRNTIRILKTDYQERLDYKKKTRTGIYYSHYVIFNSDNIIRDNNVRFNCDGYIELKIM